MKSVASMLFNSLLILTLIITPAYAATTTTKAADGAGAGGDTVFWIVLTVALTLYLTMKGTVSALLGNPIFIIGLVVILILSFIAWKAIEITFGIDSAIDNMIIQTAEVIQP